MKVSDVPKKFVLAILKFQFACNYTVNLNFDMRYLGNARSDLYTVFSTSLSSEALSYIISKLKFDVHTPSGLKSESVARVIDRLQTINQG